MWKKPVIFIKEKKKKKAGKKLDLFGAKNLWSQSKLLNLSDLNFFFF